VGVVNRHDELDAAFERAVELDDERDDREARRLPEVLHEADSSPRFWRTRS
jgi:hypothetical protein